MKEPSSFRDGASAPWTERVAQRQDGVAPYHPGAGIAHDATHRFPHVGLVAVDGAPGAGGFFRPEGAAVDAAQGIGEKPPAVGARG